MIKLEMKGFDRHERQLERMADNARLVYGRMEQVTLDELFTADFMRRHTGHSTIQALADAAPFDVNEDDLQTETPSPRWEAYIQNKTSFQNWAEMIQTAGSERLMGQLMG